MTSPVIDSEKFLLKPEPALPAGPESLQEFYRIPRGTQTSGDKSLGGFAGEQPHICEGEQHKPLLAPFLCR